jgi:two-component sensor histidine kinase
MTLGELQGDGWTRHPAPRGPRRVAPAGPPRARCGGPDAWEGRFNVRGEWRWMRTASSVRLDEAGDFVGHVGMGMDVTETRRAEDHQRLLINELNHRVKNTLATIQSLARQTLRDGVSARDARERLTERLLALSAAHNVLTRENWEGADLAEIAREAVRPYDDAGGRIAACGPPVRLAPNVALALSMALHELATNALKYGALSAPPGHVALDWRASGDRAIDIVWREIGGPPVVPPTSMGFGSRLLASLAGELGAPADVRFEPDGVVCRLRAPVA